MSGQPLDSQVWSSCATLGDGLEHVRMESEEDEILRQLEEPSAICCCMFIWTTTLLLCGK